MKHLDPCGGLCSSLTLNMKSCHKKKTQNMFGSSYVQCSARFFVGDGAVIIGDKGLEVVNDLVLVIFWAQGNQHPARLLDSHVDAMDAYGRTVFFSRSGSLKTRSNQHGHKRPV